MSMKIHHINRLFLLGILLTVLGYVSAQRVNTFEYDALHRLIKSSYANGETIEYTYDQLGNRLTRTYTYVDPNLAGPISGPDTLCAGTDNVVYSIPEYPNAEDYVWTVPSGATILSGQNTHEITVRFSEQAQSGQIGVVVHKTDGDTTSAPALDITVWPLNEISIIGPTSAIFGQTITLTAEGGGQYNWNTGETASSITVSPTDTTAYILTGINSHQCAETDTLTVNVLFYRNIITHLNITEAGAIAAPVTALDGDTVRITATTNPGYRFLYWSIDNQQVSAESIYEQVINSDLEITANFEIITYSVNYRATPFNGGTASGSITAHYMDALTITATPTEHYHFVSWEDGSTANPRIVTITSDTTFTAMFETDKFTLTVMSSDSALGSVSGGGVYEYGVNVMITAWPVAHHHFTGWQDGNTTNPRTVVVTSDSLFIASFAPDQYNIVVAPNDPQAGSVTGGGRYTYGDSVTLVATPVIGSHFEQWSDGNTENPRSFIATQDLILVAEFEFIQYHIIAGVNNDSLGSVSGGGIYHYGDTATLTAVPAAGSHFVNWNDGLTDNPRTIIVSQDVPLIANFARNYYTVTLAASNDTMGTVAGGGTFLYADTIVISATPAENHLFVSWSDGNADNPRNYVVENDITLTALFVLDSAAIFPCFHHIPDTTAFAQSVCPGELPWTWRGLTFHNAGTQSIRLEDHNGCDSILTMTLSLLPTAEIRFDTTVCGNAFPITWNGKEFTSATTLSDTLQGANGCDSIRIYTIRIYSPIITHRYADVCQGTAFNDFGFNISAEQTQETGLQTFTQTYSNATNGCDSTVKLYLNIIPSQLGAFGAMTPTDGYPVTTFPITFTWDPVQNASRYRLYLWDNSSPANADTTIIDNISANRYTFSSLPNYTSYSWKLEAYNSCVQVRSNTRSFTLNVEPTLTVTSANPLYFGETQIGVPVYREVQVSGMALEHDITYSLSGTDQSTYAVTPLDGWDSRTGGTLRITSTPRTVKESYEATLLVSANSSARSHSTNRDRGTGSRNNLSSSIDLITNLSDFFIFTTQVDRNVYPTDSTINIHGRVVTQLNQPAAGQNVEVFVTVMGMRRTFTTTSDANGYFDVDFTPQHSEAGYYQVGSGRAGKNPTEVHDDFDIPGMMLGSTSNIIWTVTQNITDSGTVTLTNRSRIPLHNITVETIQIENGCTVSFEPISLDALESKEMHYTVTGTQLTTGNQYKSLRFRAISDELASVDFSAWYYCVAPRGSLELTPNAIATNMTRGKAKLIDVEIYNNGQASTGDIVVSLPDVNWMSVVGGNTLSPLAVGDSGRFTLRLAPDSSMALTSYSGTIAVNCANGDGKSISYDILCVSDSTGSLLVDVTDEYTYNTMNGHGPHLAGATVTVTNYYSLETLAIGTTDSNGLFRLENVPEGYYRLKVNARQHDEYNGILEIKASETNHQNIFISFQAISYSWEVVPTDVEDSYTFELVTDFETHVPEPVVVIDCPKNIPFPDSIDTYNFDYVITNHGLIDALNVNFLPTISTDELTITVLINSLDTLHAQSTVIVPAQISRVQATRGSAGDVCATVLVESTYEYTCNQSSIIKNDIRLQYVGGESCRQTEHLTNPTTRIPGMPRNFDDFHADMVDAGRLLLRGIVPASLHPEWPTSQLCILDCHPCLHAIWDMGLFALSLSCPIITSIGVITYNTMDVYSSINQGEYSFFNHNSISTDAAVISSGLTLLEPLAINLPVVGQAFNIFSFGHDFVRDACQCAGSRGRLCTWLNSSKGPNGNTDAISSISNIIDIVGEIATVNKQLYDYLVGPELSNLIMEYEDTNYTVHTLVDPYDSLNNINMLIPSSLSFNQIQFLDERYANTMAILNNIQPSNNNFMYLDSISYCLYQLDSLNTILPQSENVSYSDSLKYLFQKVMDEISEEESVCSHATIQFSQEMTMTREAFNGTLSIFNGHETDAMENIDVHFTITDTAGNDKTDLFQINLLSLNQLTGAQGDGTLAANTEGSAVFQFIPTKEAAPTEPTTYAFGGYFSFIDPFNNTEVVYDLYPVEILVNPSPDLYVNYFMQRDILGDDPLTEGRIEPSIPADLGVIIQNKGAGVARNVLLQSAEPQILDNERGLNVDFEITHTSFNGQERLSGMKDVNFGNIASNSASVAEWWFSSSLLGHFTSYESHVIHNNSYGNPELSLVSSMRVHELLKTVYAYGNLDDGINDFLVNDTPDPEDIPDSLYFSDGSVTGVVRSSGVSADGWVTPEDTVIILSLLPSSIGWNYDKLNDPGRDEYELISCTREDGQIIPLMNVWQTYVTLPNSHNPIYENKLHIVDTLSFTGDSIHYTLVYRRKLKLLEVDTILGIPDIVITQPLEEFRVKFSKPIIDSTFTYRDLTLKCNGGDNLIDSTVTIQKIQDSLYSVNIHGIAAQSGYYYLTVHTDSVMDIDSLLGYYGKDAYWVQNIAIITHIHETLCYGDTYIFNEMSLTTPGTYYDTLQTSNDLDSIIVLDLSFNGITSFPYTESFDDYTESTSVLTGVEPDCWTFLPDVDNATVPQVSYGNANAQSGDYSLYMTSRGLYVMPKIVNLDNIQGLTMTFYVKQRKYAHRIAVGVMTDPADPTTFTEVERFFNGGDYTNPVQHSVDFSSYTGNGKYIAFRNVATNSDVLSINWIDDINITLAPDVICDGITVPYVENFDNTTSNTGALTGVSPDCWTFLPDVDNAAVPQISYGLDNAQSDNYSLYMTSRGLYVMPEITNIDNVRGLTMTFYVKQRKYAHRIAVGVMTDPTDPSTFVEVNRFYNEGNYSTPVQQTVNFASYSGNGKHIAFRNVATNSDVVSQNWIDDISLEETCGITVPYAENFDSLTTSTGSLTGVGLRCWSFIPDVDNATTPQVSYGSANAQSNNYSLAMTSRGIYALPEITNIDDIRGITMTFYVKQRKYAHRIAVGVMTDPSDPTTFTEIDRFYNDGNYSTPVLQTVNFASYTGNGKYIAFRNIATNSDAVSNNWIDDLNITETGTVACDGITIPYSENFDAITTSTGAPTGISPNCWTFLPDVDGATTPQVSYGSANAQSGNYSLAMTSRGIYALPEITNVDNISGLTMTFYVKQRKYAHRIAVGVMTDPTDASTFVEIDRFYNDGNYTTMVLQTVNFSDYTGTGKYIAFRNVATNSDAVSQNWIDDINITETETIACEGITVPYSENFDSVTSNTGVPTGVSPACWTFLPDVDGATAPQVSYGSTNAQSGNYSLYMTYRGIYALPEITNADSVSGLTMTFYVKQRKYAHRIAVGVMTDPTDPNTFIEVERFYNGGEYTNLVQHTVDFSNYTGTGKYIAFRNVATNSDALSQNWIDDINISATEERSGEVEQTSYEHTDNGATNEALVPLGMDDFDLNDFTVYPNPTTGELTLSMEVQQVEVNSLTGQKVAWFENTSHISISNLPAGVYILKVTMPQGIAVRKIVKR